MQTILEVLKKIEDYTISNRAEFEALVKKNLTMQQTDKVLNKLYEDIVLGTIPQDHYEQMSQ